MRRAILLQIPTVFWLVGGTISLTFYMYIGLIMFDRLKYRQQSH